MPQNLPSEPSPNDRLSLATATGFLLWCLCSTAPTRGAEALFTFLETDQTNVFDVFLSLEGDDTLGLSTYNIQLEGLADSVIDSGQVTFTPDRLSVLSGENYDLHGFNTFLEGAIGQDGYSATGSQFGSDHVLWGVGMAPLSVEAAPVGPDLADLVIDPLARLGRLDLGTNATLTEDELFTLFKPNAGVFGTSGSSLDVIESDIYMTFGSPDERRARRTATDPNGWLPDPVAPAPKPMPPPVVELPPVVVAPVVGTPAVEPPAVEPPVVEAPIAEPPVVPPAGEVEQTPDPLAESVEETILDGAPEATVELPLVFPFEVPLAVSITEWPVEVVRPYPVWTGGLGDWRHHADFDLPLPLSIEPVVIDLVNRSFTTDVMLTAYDRSLARGVALNQLSLGSVASTLESTRASSATSASAPEPSAAVLVLLGLAGIAARGAVRG